MVESCDICAEKYNRSNRLPITCYCGFKCCRKCIKTFILDKNDDAACMSCKQPFARKFMSENFEKSFMNNQYKKLRENILFDRTLALLPATQPHVEKKLKLDSLNKERINIEQEIANLKTKLQNVYINIRDQHESEKIVEERKEFIRQCPNNDCKGFLSSSLKCELCNKWTCAECREIKGNTKDAEHECDKDIVESVKLMKKDTKPCPKCASPIFKLAGCDAMYCIQCDVSFSWKTLRIINGVVHNPEYFDKMRRLNNGEEGSSAPIPRNPNDILCGREIDNHFIRNLSFYCKKIPNKTDIDTIEEIPHHIFRQNNIQHFVKHGNYFREITQKIDEYIIYVARSVIHIRSVEQNRFRNNNLTDNMDLRINYMLNIIDKDNLKTNLQKREKKEQKNNDINGVLTLYVNCMTDLFYRLIDDIKEYKNILSEMHELRTITNDILQEISVTYKCKQYILDDQNFLFY